MNKHIIFRGLRKILRDRSSFYSEEYVQLFGQAANDFIRDEIRNAADGLMISKFGTVELDNICCFLANKHGINMSDLYHAIRGHYSIFPDESMKILCRNAGFFPNDSKLGYKYLDLVIKDMNEIDILGSYQKNEKFILNNIKNCKKVDLNGYYAPFMWKNPWSSELKNKRVLVIHPFTESIKYQYERREKIFENPEVLPEFKELILVKAVQSIADSKEQYEYENWFKALDSMKKEIDSKQYDIALIGCGAYGMDLAAHIKRQGKIAIHLAGWTQMLFGIYGNRWTIDQPEFAKYINEYWIRPSEKEKPLGAEKIENACYW